MIVLVVFVLLAAADNGLEAYSQDSRIEFEKNTTLRLDDQDYQSFIEAQLILTKNFSEILKNISLSSSSLESLKSINITDLLANNISLTNETIPAMAYKNQMKDKSSWPNKIESNSTGKAVQQNSTNLMSYFNARNLSQNQLEILKSLLSGACWRDSFGRGAGESVSECTSAQEKDGALCYPKCDEGYRGVGPMCWETCRAGFEDRGVFCIIDLHIYEKGCCCVLNQCCNSCQANYTDDGCTCRRPPVSYTKKSYGRGTGASMNCKPNYELNGLLCYPTCQEGYTGAGPVCWKKCSDPLAQSCGAMCTINQNDCVYKSFSLAFTVGMPFNAMTAWIAGPAALTNLESVVDIPVQYSIPKCI